MDRSILPRGASEAGFLLVEAMIAVALIALCAGAALAAVVAVTHAAARDLSTPALTATAQNVLTDLRAATAYDPVQLAALAGRSVSFEVSEPASDGSPQLVQIVTSVSRSAPDGAAYVGSVTARAANGTAVRIKATLVQEAPAPGSVIPSSTPPPTPPSDTGNAGQIQL